METKNVKSIKNQNVKNIIETSKNLLNDDNLLNLDLENLDNNNFDLLVNVPTVVGYEMGKVVSKYEELSELKDRITLLKYQINSLKSRSDMFSVLGFDLDSEEMGEFIGANMILDTMSKKAEQSKKQFIQCYPEYESVLNRSLNRLIKTKLSEFKSYALELD